MITVTIISLGCAKNQVDSEEIAAVLEAGGYKVISDLNSAEVIIVNTCAFIESALDESIETLLSLVKYKHSGKCRALIALGCMVERYRDELLEEIPELDGIVGVNVREELPKFIKTALEGKRSSNFSGCPWGERIHFPRNIKSSWAYLKIAEGCNRHCTYCIIPSLRGKLSSMPVESIVKEAIDLSNKGIKEINLIAQDTTAYGIDRGTSLVRLLKSLDSIPGIEWLRVLYAHPQGVTKELIQLFAEQKNICEYIDLPFQHANKKILANMHRGGGTNEFLDLIALFRSYIPDITFRSTFIVGFPGETEQDFLELLDFLNKAQLDKVGFFSYSREEGTKSALFPNQIDEDVKNDRLYRAERLQEQIACEKQQMKIGKVLPVLIEKQLEDHIWQGREPGMAPEVDGLVNVCSRKYKGSLRPGQIINVSITDSNSLNLRGEVSL